MKYKVTRYTQSTLLNCLQFAEGTRHSNYCSVPGPQQAQQRFTILFLSLCQCVCVCAEWNGMEWQGEAKWTYSEHIARHCHRKWLKRDIKQWQRVCLPFISSSNIRLVSREKRDTHTHGEPFSGNICKQTTTITHLQANV